MAKTASEHARALCVARGLGEPSVVVQDNGVRLMWTAQLDDATRARVATLFPDGEWCTSPAGSYYFQESAALASPRYLDSIHGWMLVSAAMSLFMYGWSSQ